MQRLRQRALTYLAVIGLVGLALGATAVAEPPARAANWIPIGKASFRGNTSPSITAMASDTNGNLYVGGTFTEISGVPLNHIGRWNGSEWSALGAGVNAPVRAIAVSGADVYVGGEFLTAGGIETHAIAKWDGKSWSALGGGVNGFVNAIAVFRGEVYVGGQFGIRGDDAIRELARWNGSGWFKVGDAFIVNAGEQDGGVHSLLLEGGSLYVGGVVRIMTSPTGVNLGPVARWDGGRWFGMGNPPISGFVKSMAMLRGDLYVSGTLQDRQQTLAWWNGTSWSFPRPDVGAPSRHGIAMVTHGGSLVVGGAFRVGERFDNAVQWDGGAWSTLGAGLEEVFSLANAGSQLYAGGKGFIARWDGSSSPVAPPSPKEPEPVLRIPEIVAMSDPLGITLGQSARLVWETHDAESVVIVPDIGPVELNGMREVSPASSTTYTITATGPDGTASANVSVSVSRASVSRPPATIDGLISSYPPILFEKDQDTVSPEELRKLDGLIKLLKDNGTVRIIVEGHADDGCSQECSLMLAYRRGEAVVEVLKAAGIAASRISRVSYGKERPACRADIEYCRPQNRRVQFRRGL